MIPLWVPRERSGLKTLFCFLGMLLSCGAFASAGEDWPQFRGSSQEGKSDASDLPVAWSEAQNVKWKTAVAGEGWSSPVILGSQIWLTTSTEEGKSLRAVCVDRESGKIVHDVECFRVSELQPKNSFNSYASPTPVIEPGRVYVSYGTYGNACIDTTTGAILWKNDELKIDHREGPGSSPVLYKNLYLLHCDGCDTQYLVALDKQTGKILWKTQRSYDFSNVRSDMRKAFSMPLAATVNGHDQLLSVGSHRAYGYNPENGSELWHIDLPGFSNVPRPVLVDGVAYISTGYMNPELWAIKIDGPSPEVIWKAKQGTPLKPSVLVMDGLLYMVADNGIARCLDAKTGAQFWQSRILSSCSASPILANGLLYFFDERGKAAVLKPGKTLQVVAENQLDGRVLASPAVVGKALYVRTDKALYRIEK
ncbi:MAG: Pyrrolo-quinoline quinone [Phycisphaerales bacterium]|nr:Pyrrolo-quinoline quinone [Phycisphaerales bacterium]